MFTKKTSHHLPYQFFFHKEAVFHKQTGTLLVSSRKHKLKNQEISFSIVGITKADQSSLTLHLVNAIFEEAKKAGFKPHALTSYGDQKEFCKFRTENKLKSSNLKLSDSQDLSDTIIAKVKVETFKTDTNKTFTIGVYSSTLSDSYYLATNPENVKILFDFIISNGLMPRALVEFNVGKSILKKGAEQALEAINKITDTITPKTSEDRTPSFLKRGRRILPGSFVEGKENPDENISTDVITSESWEFNSNTDTTKEGS